MLDLSDYTPPKPKKKRDPVIISLLTPKLEFLQVVL